MGPLILLLAFIPVASAPYLFEAVGFIQYLTPVRLVGIVSALWAVGRDVARGRFPPILRPTFSKVYLVYIVMMVLSGLFCVYVRGLGGAVREKWQQLLSFMFFYYVVLSCVREVRHVRWVAATSALTMGFFSIGSLIRYATGAPVSDELIRQAGLSVDPNYYAVALLLVIPMAMYLVHTTPNPVLKMMWGLCSLVLMGALFTTVSRGGIVVGLPVLLLAMLALSRNKGKAMLGLGVLVVIGALVLVSTAPGQHFIQSFLERMARSEVVEDVRGVGEAELSTTTRYHLYIAGLKMTLYNWYIGVGPGNFYWYSIDYGAIAYNMAHNMYLATGGELGLIGLGAFLGMIYLTFRDLLWIRRRALEVGDVPSFCMSNAFFSGLLAFCACSLFLHSEAEKFFWMVMFVTVAFRIRFQEERAGVLGVEEPVRMKPAEPVVVRPTVGPNV